MGTLLYAAISTRPDIAFDVNKLTQKMHAPTVRDANACDRVFRYLQARRHWTAVRRRVSVREGHSL